MNKKIITVITMALVLSLSLFLSGCDDFNLIELLNNDIALIPSEVTLNLNESIEFKVSAGIPPFSFTDVGEGPLLNGVFTAPATAGSFTISVMDARSRIAEAYVTVIDAVIIRPEMVITGIDGVVQFTISGGIGPHTVALDPPPGLGNLGLIAYEAASDEYYIAYNAVSTGMETIRVTDFNGQVAEAYVTINNNSDLLIIPEVAEVAVDSNYTFSASGGTGPGTYVFSLESGVGIIDPVNGKYSSSVSGTAIIRVTDGTPVYSEATIYIVAPEDVFSIIPSLTQTIFLGDPPTPPLTFSAANGTPSYQYFILPGDEAYGTINIVTGEFTALLKTNSITVVVHDNNGLTDTCRIKIKD